MKAIDRFVIIVTRPLYRVLFSDYILGCWSDHSARLLRKRDWELLPYNFQNPFQGYSQKPKSKLLGFLFKRRDIV